MTSQFNFQSVKQRSYFEEPQQFNTNSGGKVQSSLKTKLTKKSTLQGFKLVDLVWIRPSEVRYIDPEQPKTKRNDGSYQKIIKFGQKGVEDYIDPPYNQSLKHRNINRIKSNTDNPLHANFYYINLLNGQFPDIYQNFNNLKKQIFS